MNEIEDDLDLIASALGLTPYQGSNNRTIQLAEEAVSRLRSSYASLLESLRAAEKDRDVWRSALCEVLQLVPLHFEDIENVRIDRSPGGDPAKDEHPKGEWVAWDSEYPEDGSVSLNVMASPPHMAQVKADEELSTALAAAEQRAEAAEKRIEQQDSAIADLNGFGIAKCAERDAAEKRSRDLMDLLREARHYADWAPTRPIELLARIDAALHDEERSDG